ncbi:MAG: hypothetical protein HYX68_13710 [Planctomycetes bacterium]|nr:hypothetical protein [Planctomycetota bacterium]
MSRKKTSTVLDMSPSNGDQGGLDQLTSTVDTLSQEVRVLREAIDELRELLEWAMQNREAAAGHHPLSPAAGVPREAVDKEEDENINRTKPDRQPADDEEEASTPAAGELF